MAIAAVDRPEALFRGCVDKDHKRISSCVRGVPARHSGFFSQVQHCLPGIAGEGLFVTASTANPYASLLTTALESSGNLVCIKDETLDILYANRAMLDLYAPEMRGSVVGGSGCDIFTEEDAARCEAQDREALDQGSSQGIVDFADHRGRRFTLALKKSRFVDAEGNIRLLCIGTDISDLKEQNERVAQSNQTLEKFAALTAHDLASPLGTASLMLQMLQLRPGIREQDHVRASIDEIGGVIESATRKISSVLILQKAILTQDLHRQFVSLGDVVIRVEASLKAQLAASSARIVFDRLPRIECEPLLAETLLQNLIENSLKYRSMDDPVIRVTHILMGAHMVISVADNGIGMGSLDGARIFQLFEQGDRRERGLGVGLGLCKNIVDAHGGVIWVDPNYRGGTRINFTLAGGVDRDAERDGGLSSIRRAPDFWDEEPGLPL
ncbi:PAS domain-containing sensor histidine kinase [Sphingobium aquiterrae]|uniref:PAS domain-containing sensor histidine kinase n=1 Tax=Sphingobium aquiterrae TaxID=2038656 RepID=UPI0030196A5B